MSRFYRYRLPPWLRQCIAVIEQVMLPLAAFQLLRTLFIPTTFDILLSGLFIFIYIAFMLKWL